MIFVTVGNGKFDELIKEIDYLKREKKILSDVIIQIGHGNYKPKFCQWFKFEPTLDKYYDQAYLVISHGGPGIVFEVLRLGKKLIAVPNRNRTDPNHQVEYLRAMAKETSALIYCDKVKLVGNCIKNVQKQNTKRIQKYKNPKCKINEVIKQFLK